MRTLARIACLTLAAVFGAALPAVAQDADKIIDAYIKASGSSSKLRKVNTLSLQGALTRESDGKSGAYTLHLKSPNRYYAELSVSGEPEIFAYNGKSAWREDAKGQIGTLLGPSALQMEALALISNSRLLERKKNKIFATSVGNSQLDGREVSGVEVASQNGSKRTLFFDSQTHLLVKETGDVAGEIQDTYFDDYRPASGVQVARKLKIHRGSETYDVDVSQVEINPTIGERAFDFPQKTQVKLPDLKKLFEEIDGNQKAIDKVRENYSGRRSEEETELDKNGKVTHRDLHDFTFFYLNGEEVSTLVAKDGRALSPKEQEKENESTRKRIEEIQKRQARKEAKEEKKKEQAGKDKDDDPGIETFLHVCQFVNPRRERFRGQDVLVFDFEPNPEYRAKSLVEGIVQKLAGVVWVDEKAHQVARIEGYFVGDAKIAAGLLVNLQKGSSFVYEQAFINNEVWLPTYAEAHIGARVLLVKGFKVNALTRYSDYKRFNVETLNTIAKPKEPDQNPAPQ